VPLFFTTYSWAGADDEEAIRAIHKGLDLGINFLDTADVYGFGHSEKLISKALARLDGFAGFSVCKCLQINASIQKVFTTSRYFVASPFVQRKNILHSEYHAPRNPE